VLDHLYDRLPDCHFRINAKYPAHCRIHQQDGILLVEEHHTVVDIVEYRFQPGTFCFRNLGPPLQGSCRTIDFAPQPVAHAVGIPETIFHCIDNIVGSQRRRQVTAQAESKDSLDQLGSDFFCIDQERQRGKTRLQLSGDLQTIMPLESLADQQERWSGFFQYLA
jgi:hypothetical protein